MKIAPVHHAILCYLEWHCDRRIPFRTVRRMARDLARNESEVQRGMQQLMAWGLVSMRHDGENQFHTVRLGDGRETIPHTQVSCTFSTVVHRRGAPSVDVESRQFETRIAA